MTKNNVTLPKEVAEAIEKLRSEGFDNANIIYDWASGANYKNQYGKSLADFASDDNFDTLLKALVNGYEVEQTPEEEIAAYYKEAIMKIGENSPNGPIMEAYAEGQMQAIHFVLKQLGLEIDGIPLGWKKEGAN